MMWVRRVFGMGRHPGQTADDVRSRATVELTTARTRRRTIVADGIPRPAPMFVDPVVAAFTSGRKRDGEQ